MTGAEPPNLAFLFPVEEGARVQLWSFSPGDDVRLLYDLERRRDRILADVEALIEGAIETLRARVATYVPADLLPPTTAGEEARRLAD